MPAISTLPALGGTKSVCPETCGPPQSVESDNGGRFPSYKGELPRRYLENRQYGLRYSGRVVQLDTRFDSAYVRAGGAARGNVREFSASSRRNLVRVASALPWAGAGLTTMVTLTYPADFPRDGRVWKRHLGAWRRRFERQYGRKPVGIWKQEFQGRGAVHFHLFLQMPDELDLAAFQAWTSEAWYSVVGSGDIRHLMAGTSVDLAWSNGIKYFAYAYKSDGESKEYQNTCPDDVVNPGRWWGVWGAGPDWSGELLTDAEWHTVRRVLRKWASSKRGSRRSADWRARGEWYVTDGQAAVVMMGKLGRLIGGDLAGVPSEPVPPRVLP